MDNKVLGYANHDTAMACLAMTNERDLYTLIAKLPRRPKYLTFLWSICLYANKHGFHQSKLNRDEVLAHAQSIWDDHHNEG